MFAIPIRAALLAALVCAAAVLPLDRALAQQEPFPSRTITVIYPYSGLGGFEAMMRAIFAAAQERLGQQIVIEPRGGANGAIGMTALARSRPDGHTIGLTNVSPTTVLPFIQTVEFDSAKDYAPVILLGRGESFVLAGPALKAGSLGELIALAKAQPGTITWSVIGAAQKLNIAKIEAATGAKFLQVPYKGNAESVSALVGGHLMVAVDSGDPKVLARGGALRVLGTNNPVRNPRFPDLPAVAEYAPGFESRSWHGVLAPSGTPRDRVAKLYAALSAALQQPKIRELMVTSGLEPAGEDPAAFAAIINNDLKTNSELIRKYNITN
jgi:tripartite-type tricarboxylate transporter receptor subunit TctC